MAFLNTSSLPERALDLLRDPAKHGLLLPPAANPRFVAVPHTAPLPIWAAVVPPLSYMLALALLPPQAASAPAAQRYGAAALRSALALVSLVTFARLPFAFHVPGSAILTYQLGLVGCYGAARVLDVFALSAPRVPRRVVIPQPQPQRGEAERAEGNEPSDPREKYSHAKNDKWVTEPLPTSVAGRLWYAFDLMISMRGVGWDFASADVRHDRHPWQPPSERQLRRAFGKLLPVLVGTVVLLRAMLKRLAARSADLETPTIAALPPGERALFVVATGISLYALFDFGYTLVSAAALPALHTGARIADGIAGSAAAPAQGANGAKRRPSLTEAAAKALPLPRGKANGGAEGPVEHALHAHNVDFFPLLNPITMSNMCSLRSFWSRIWHRLFHRAFLIYGVLPFQNAALLLEAAWARAFGSGSGKGADGVTITWPAKHADPGRVLQKGRADWAKVLGAFVASGFIHAVSERAALGGRFATPPPHHLHAPSAGVVRGLALDADGRWHGLGRWSLSRLIPPVAGAGEFMFFFLNGVAVVLEGAVARAVLARRRQSLLRKRAAAGEDASKIRIEKAELIRWYDRVIGAVWAVAVLAFTGECFVEGWIRSGIVAELTFSIF